MQIGQKTYKTCFFALSLSFLYKVGKLEKLSLRITFKTLRKYEQVHSLQHYMPVGILQP